MRIDLLFYNRALSCRVGVILCVIKDDAVVEYARSCSMSPTMVAEYTLRLPVQKLLEEKLREITMLAGDTDE